MPNRSEFHGGGRMDAAIKLGHPHPVEREAAVPARWPAPGRMVDLSHARLPEAAGSMPSATDGSYDLHLILAGQCRPPLPRHARPIGAGHVFLRPSNDAGALNCSDDFDSFVVRLPAETVHELCQTHGWIRPEGGAAYSTAPLRNEERRRFLKLCELVREEVDAGGAPPEVLHNYARVLTCKLIAALDQGCLHEEADAQARCFARVVQFIDDNVRHDITAERLAHHAGLSVRSLYLLFEKQARMTPKAYIRKKKLEHVYSTLMDPASRVANVTAVALEFGFRHLGRFAELYRETFGILPSTSLKARHGSHHKVD